MRQTRHIGESVSLAYSVFTIVGIAHLCVRARWMRWVTGPHACCVYAGKLSSIIHRGICLFARIRDDGLLPTLLRLRGTLMCVLARLTLFQLTSRKDDERGQAKERLGLVWTAPIPRLAVMMSR